MSFAATRDATSMAAYVLAARLNKIVLRGCRGLLSGNELLAFAPGRFNSVRVQAFKLGLEFEQPIQMLAAEIAE